MDTRGSAGTRVDAEALQSGWRVAALPSLALLGAVLPLAFIPQVEDLLYYLRPLELLPAYGTAWLLLAALALPVWLIATLLLTILGSTAALRGARAALTIALAGVAAAITLAALLYCLLVWVQTFGWLRGVALRGAVLWTILILGFIAGCTAHGRRTVLQLRPLLIGCLAAGALCALAVPLAGWGHG